MPTANRVDVRTFLDEKPAVPKIKTAKLPEATAVPAH
jgi:hypothetical protein